MGVGNDGPEKVFTEYHTGDLTYGGLLINIHDDLLVLVIDLYFSHSRVEPNPGVRTQPRYVRTVEYTARALPFCIHDTPSICVLKVVGLPAVLVRASGPTGRRAGRARGGFPPVHALRGSGSPMGSHLINFLKRRLSCINYLIVLQTRGSPYGSVLIYFGG